MDSLTLRAFDVSLGSGLTTNAVDNKRAVLALRAARTPRERIVVMALVKEKRENHRIWIVRTQREWQIRKRRVNARGCAHRAKLWGREADDAGIIRAEQESVDVRERYVRCNM